jgi:hypothetical protein
LLLQKSRSVQFPALQRIVSAIFACHHFRRPRRAHLRFLDLAVRSRNRNRNRNPMSRIFDHEKLEVYRAALAFLDWLEPLVQKFPKSLPVVDQLDRASTSIPLNIAEGNGRSNSDYRLHGGNLE